MKRKKLLGVLPGACTLLFSLTCAGETIQLSLPPIQADAGEEQVSFEPEGSERVYTLPAVYAGKQEVTGSGREAVLSAAVSLSRAEGMIDNYILSSDKSQRMSADGRIVSGGARWDSFELTGENISLFGTFGREIGAAFFELDYSSDL